MKRLFLQELYPKARDAKGIGSTRAKAASSKARHGCAAEAPKDSWHQHPPAVRVSHRHCFACDALITPELHICIKRYCRGVRADSKLRDTAGATERCYPLCPHLFLLLSGRLLSDFPHFFPGEEDDQRPPRSLTNDGVILVLGRSSQPPSLRAAGVRVLRAGC